MMMISHPCPACKPAMLSNGSTPEFQQVMGMRGSDIFYIYQQRRTLPNEGSSKFSQYTFQNCPDSLCTLLVWGLHWRCKIWNQNVFQERMKEPKRVDDIYRGEEDHRLCLDSSVAYSRFSSPSVKRTSPTTTWNVRYGKNRSPTSIPKWTIIISDAAYTTIEILSEKFQPNVNERWGVFEAISETADETVILKIRHHYIAHQQEATMR